MAGTDQSAVRSILNTLSKTAESTAQAHESFLDFSNQLTRTYAETFELKSRLLAMTGQAPVEKKETDPPALVFTRNQCLEFARGSEHGGFKQAFEHLDKSILERMAILYINVSWEESLRKNRARFNPDKPDSILEHGLSDEKLEKLYREVDWEVVSAADPEFITIKGIKVPYVVFENEDDVTTGRGEALGQRLEETLKRLWGIRK